MMKKNVFVLLFVITIIIGIATPAFAERLKYTGLARSEGGAVLASATVAVYLAGTTTPADVYEASSGGTSVNEVTTDSNGRWTFYADTTDYAFTQEYKVVVTKDGYSSITLDNIFILRLPTNAAGVLTNDGSGNYSWGDLGFDESANYTPTGTWDFSGDIEISKVNSAGGSANALTLSGTLGEMDSADDTFYGIKINYTNANHTNGDFNAIRIESITKTPNATETGIFINSGWDAGLVSYSEVRVQGDGSTTKGNLRLYDLDNSAYVAITPADETTSWTMTLPAAEPTGLLRADAGTVSTTTSISGTTISGGTASTVAAWDGSQNLTSLSSQNVVTTGQIDGKVKVMVITGTTTIDASASNQAVYYINGADSARTLNLPAAAAGLAYCFANALYAKALTIHPASGDYVILTGENNDSSDVVSSGANTDKICVLGIDTTYWLVTASAGTWAND